VFLDIFNPYLYTVNEKEIISFDKFRDEVSPGISDTQTNSVVQYNPIFQDNWVFVLR
jgi:hypothetical protein